MNTTNSQQLICKECGQSREKGRKLCRPCNLKRLLASSAKTRKEKGRYMFNNSCEACKKEYKAFRKEQRFCSECWEARNKLAAESISTNQYVYVSLANREKHENKWAHRRLAESLLKRKLTCHEVVHHIDDNPKNNNADNLIVMNRGDHVRLHKYLDDQRVILEQSGNENIVNCWNNLIVPMTTAWLETTSAKVKKLSEIGQSAAKLLLKEEGPETRHDASNLDEGIVQTTTERDWVTNSSKKI